MNKKRRAGLYGVVLLMLYVGIFWLPETTFSQEKYSVTWTRIQDDDGSQESYWGVANCAAHVLCKIINLDADPAQLEEAKITYKMGFDPYNLKLNKYFNKPVEGMVCPDMIIKVNDKIVVQKSPIELATKGWHEISIKPELLKKGDNTIKFTWAENPKGASDTSFYMAIDTTTKNLKRSCSSADNGKTFISDTLRPGVAPKDIYQGEYMVRLEIIPLVL